MSTARRLLLASPYPLDSPRGNSVSANRILGILKECGYSADAVSGREETGKASGEILIALHARKSATAIESFHANAPDRPVFILLTGSDLYADLHGSAETQATVHRTMRLARYLIVSQSASIADIPEIYQSKARVVPKSLLTKVPERLPRKQGPFRIVLPSHLRPAKAPLLVLEALAALPSMVTLQVDHFGTAEDPDLGQAATSASQAPGSRYHWHGNVPHAEVLAGFATSDLLLNTSRVEGGANVLCEAIQMGLPCIATDIPPNAGMLGEHYPGLFPMDDAPALANLLERVTCDEVFLQKLSDAVRARAPLFTREAESHAWRTLIEESI